ncbi:MAG TPA: thioredoxin domain-containing protein [Anaeromyxobacter sp.]|nr:thioredoxin domain-containing protein [Anaeromyxobacter sp.]
MTILRAPALLPALAGLLLACRTPQASGPAPAEPPAEPAAASAPDDDPQAALSGLPLMGLGPAERKLLAEYARGEYCYCGCPHTLSSCLLHHQACKHAARMVGLAAAVAARPGATVDSIRRFVGRYYSSFDRRASIDLAGFGPQLGEAAAPVTLVEYSDFTCPFCQAFRPTLEAFVAAHPGRVKLYFKPFPIESHPGALDAALAGEWAREQGKFWPMHDALFSAPSHDLEALAGVAEALGLDASALRDEVASRRLEARIRKVQDEGRSVGVRGTPTLFMNGRLLDLPENSTTWLEFTLQDEEEWLQNHGGWARD